jgi:carbon storage regulator
MLILSRKVGEALIIGEEGNEVIVTLMGIKQNFARIGVIAPKEVPVHREEVVHRIRAGEVRINGQTVIEADPDKLQFNKANSLVGIRNRGNLQLSSPNVDQVANC